MTFLQNKSSKIQTQEMKEKIFLTRKKIIDNIQQHDYDLSVSETRDFSSLYYRPVIKKNVYNKINKLIMHKAMIQKILRNSWKQDMR